MANTTIPSELIAADAITGAKIADNAVDSEHYTDGSIDTAHIADDQVTLAKMAGLARGKIIVGDSSGNPAALAIGTNGYVLKSDGTDIAWAADADTSSLTSEQVQDIAGAMFSSNTETGITATYQDADGTIDLVVGTLNQNTTGSAATLTTARAIAVAGDVTGTANFDGSAAISITTTLATDAIVTANITDANITVAKMAANSVDSDQYVDGSIDTAHIADSQITSAKIADGTIATADIADNAITLAKMASGTDGNIISFDASGNPVAIATGSDGQVLTSTGAGSPPAFEDAAGGVTGITSNADATAITIDSSERVNFSKDVGINEATPDFSGFGSNGGGLEIDDAGSSFSALRVNQGGTGDFYVAVSTGAAYLWGKANSPIVFGTNNTERLRLDDTGEFLVNRTDGFGTGGAAAMFVTGRSDVGIYVTGPNTSGYALMSFHNGGLNQIGAIKNLNNNALTFYSNSDYRLKENVNYTWDATTRLKQLKPARFNWISDDSNTVVDGFLAHEVSSIVPDAVDGTKDATKTDTNCVLNSEGNLQTAGVTEAEWVAGKAETPPRFESNTSWTASHTQNVYQAIDESKLVPLLVKTIQELEARITTLEG